MWLFAADKNKWSNSLAHFAGGEHTITQAQLLMKIDMTRQAHVRILATIWNAPLLWLNVWISQGLSIGGNFWNNLSV